MRELAWHLEYAPLVGLGDAEAHRVYEEHVASRRDLASLKEESPRSARGAHGRATREHGARGPRRTHTQEPPPLISPAE